MARVTIADVAGHAGVSAMTVSNVLNGRPGASDATRERVLAVARELGYVPNLAARGLKGGRTGLVGVVMHDLTSQYALEITRGIADQLGEVELEVLISATYQDASRERQRIELLARGMVDGLILIAPVLDVETIEALHRMSGPVVVVDPRRMDCPFPHIVVDNYDGIRSAVDHLVSRGHRDIAFIAGDPEFDSSAERLAGYVEGMRLAGMRDDETNVVSSPFTYDGGLRAMLDILDTHRPTAVVASSDLIAFGAIDAIRSEGLRVPDDVSIVGFDDLPQAAQSFPGLSTVRTPLHDIGGVAVRSLVSMLDGGEPLQRRTEIKTTFVSRGSVATLAEEPIR